MRGDRTGFAVSGTKQTGVLLRIINVIISLGLVFVCQSFVSEPYGAFGGGGALEESG